MVRAGVYESMVPNYNRFYTRKKRKGGEREPMPRCSLEKMEREEWEERGERWEER